MDTLRKTILIVDDDPVGRKLLQRHLENYTLYEACDGVEGFDAFIEHAPDVVITDLKMPRRDGLTLFKMLKEKSPLTPIIVLSGQGRMSDVIEILRLGAHNYLEKPIEDREIVAHTVEKAFAMLYLERANLNYQHNLEKLVAEKTAELREELAARDRVERELLHAQKEWERTFNAIPDLITIIDKDYNIVKSNRAMADALRLNVADVEGATCYAVVHGTEKPPLGCPHTALLQDGRKHIIEYYEDQLGEYYEVTAIPYYDDDETTLLGSVHISRNINERKEFEAEREIMQGERLHAQKLESVGQLASGIAHEINTPVQFVSTNNEFLSESFETLVDLMSEYEKLIKAARDGEIPASLIERIKVAQEEADWEYLQEEIPSALQQNHDGLQRVAAIVRAMKEFSHPGAKEKESRNLNDIIKTTGIVAKNEWKYVAELEMDLDESMPPIMCYSDDIGQVFLNIIINAAHAIEDKLGRNPEGEKGRITISTGMVNGYAEIRISDTGVGIPEKVVKKIFDPFYTTKKIGRGTGQGLAIAWNIITDKHKGKFKVESEVGSGTTFSIRIPVQH